MPDKKLTPEEIRELLKQPIDVEALLEDRKSTRLNSSHG